MNFYNLYNYDEYEAAIFCFAGLSYDKCEAYLHPPSWDIPLAKEAKNLGWSVVPTQLDNGWNILCPNCK